MTGAVLFISFAILLLMGTPIAVCLGVSSVGAMLVDGSGKPIETIMTTLPRIFSSSTSKFVLLAIPFFILGGNIMEKAGISERLINFAQTCVGHLKGGLIVVMVAVACFFAAISGSGPATVAALGMILIPAMVNAGYPAAFSAASWRQRAPSVSSSRHPSPSSSTVPLPIHPSVPCSSQVSSRAS